VLPRDALARIPQIGLYFGGLQRQAAGAAAIPRFRHWLPQQSGVVPQTAGAPRFPRPFVVLWQVWGAWQLDLLGQVGFSKWASFIK
jgi:hypothetical protein